MVGTPGADVGGTFAGTLHDMSNTSGQAREKLLDKHPEDLSPRR
jgi:hypothetical protein